MSVLNGPTARRLGKLLRLLSSDFDGEALAAVAAMRRLFETEKLSFNDLAAVIEGTDEGRPKFTENDARKIYEEGVRDGLAKARSAAQESDFFDSDGSPCWPEIAVYCRAKAGQLRNEREREFVSDMAVNTLEREPTLKQARWLLRTFVKLGGHCDNRARATYF
jgi:hypothetical protein